MEPLRLNMESRRHSTVIRRLSFDLRFRLGAFSAAERGMTGLWALPAPPGPTRGQRPAPLTFRGIPDRDIGVLEVLVLAAAHDPRGVTC